MVDAGFSIGREGLEEYVKSIFLSAGLDTESSELIARHLVLANLRGVDSHGVSRVDIYTRRLAAGLVEKENRSRIVREADAFALIDGGNSSGIVVASQGIRLAIGKAKTTGISIVGIRNSNHCGMLADYTMQAAKEGCIALAVTNAPPSMAPWGGRGRFFGTNPFSYAMPAGEENDIVFDMATSLVAKGKIIIAQKNGQDIPLGWAISKEGKPTTNPTEALEGLVLPVGGPKGYGITFMVEALSSLFTGAAFGPYIGDLYNNFSQPQDIGQCFIVMRADLFQELQQFKQRMDQMIQEIRAVPLMEGVERIYLPGELEELTMARRIEKGIPLSAEIVAELKRVAERYEVREELEVQTPA